MFDDIFHRTCLKAIDPKDPPPTPNKPIITKYECDLTKALPGLNGVHFINLNGNILQDGLEIECDHYDQKSCC